MRGEADHPKGLASAVRGEADAEERHREADQRAYARRRVVRVRVKVRVRVRVRLRLCSETGRRLLPRPRRAPSMMMMRTLLAGRSGAARAPGAASRALCAAVASCA